MAKAMSSRAIRELRERTRKEKHDKKRKVATRKVHLNYLIVCEGERTEPNYFRALVGGRNSRVLDVNILGEGQSTCRLVNTAIEEREKSMIELMELAPHGRTNLLSCGIICISNIWTHQLLARNI